MIGAETAKVNVIAPHFGEGKVLSMASQQDGTPNIIKSLAYKATMVLAPFSSLDVIYAASFARTTILPISETASMSHLKSLLTGT